MLPARLARRKCAWSDQRGFTLIEVLITSVILAAVVGGGISGFITFNEKQTLVGAARQLQAFMRSAQSRAASQDIPPGCETGTNKFWAYRVRFRRNTAGTDVTMNGICADTKSAAQSAILPATPRDSFTLPAGVSVTMTLPPLAGCSPGQYMSIDYYILQYGVDLNGELTCAQSTSTVTLTGAGGRTYSFVITNGGTITEGQLN